jgi:1,4-dihydroxy-2-naphthoyl-CoA hydrolase
MATTVMTTEALHQAMPFTAVLGIEVLASSPDEVRARIPWSEDRCTAGGVLHGGVLIGLADACGGTVAFLNLPEDANGTTTIESKTNFFRAVRSGYVEAVSKPLHKGRTTVVVETDLFDPDQKHVARVTQTQAVLYPR